MSISQDGNDLVFDGIVRLTNAFDPTTGVATVIFSPRGGIGNLPALATGGPGLPPVIDGVTLHEVAPGDALPTSTFNLVSPGGAGVASHYTVDLYVHSGAKGDDGTAAAILDASDVDATSLVNGYILQYNSTTGKMTLTAQKVGGLYLPASYASTSGNSNARTLASYNIPAQPFDWRPIVFGQTVVSGTANTRVDLSAHLINTTGDQVGYGFGQAGAAPATAICIPASGAALTGGYGKVAAGVAVDIYFQATQMNSTTDAWVTNAATTTFETWVQPIN